MTEEQRDIIREAMAYRYLFWGIGVKSGKNTLSVSAKSSNGSRTIWGPHLLGTGTFTEMSKLRDRAMAEYRKLVGAKQ
jgi:hypothetical protein